MNPGNADNVDNALASVIRVFEESRNDQNAILMKRYMKNKFEFLGIKAPERREIMRPLMKEAKKFPREQMVEFVKRLWDLSEREYQYFALDYLEKNIKVLVEEDIQFLEYLIKTKSWWDTVDILASKCVGYHFTKYPNLITEYGVRWAVSENIWLRRTAILFQLKYKEKTDKELLFQIIEKNAHDDEFFIQKGIGWALREYSKTNKEEVAAFINSHPLSNLSKREGKKYL
ncbi:DNA alkylation repair protein [Anaerobacillus alkalidiazotrophicus]|uniref:DNA alkylation repair protein n=1 Tax=Anaerobacillus alkalidiazotrophicus TaxID=472963 RepID=A0A1S2MD72_9BACI|nr:DNA alkylation repair protein [Anaerobacillus alkalidiazotrophicus]